MSSLTYSPVSALSFLLELPTELDNPIAMESLRNFAEKESEDTLNAFTSPTREEGNRARRICEEVSPWDKTMSYVHSAAVHVFLFVGQGALNKADAKFTKKWKDHLSYFVNTAMET